VSNIDVDPFVLQLITCEYDGHRWTGETDRGGVGSGDTLRNEVGMGWQIKH